MAGETEVLGWLRSHGYPLELQVAHTLRRTGWRVEHARWYRDPDTSKLRELDLLASRSERTSDESDAGYVRLAIECKSSPGKPWVAFTAPAAGPVFVLLQRLAADEPSRDALKVLRAKRVALPTLLEVGPTLGHGLVKAHTENKSGDPTAPYAGLRAVSTAAVSLGKRYEASILRWGGSISGPQIVLPVVVLAGELFEYSLDDNADERLSPVDRVHVAVAGSDERPNYVLVTTITGFERTLVAEAPSVSELCMTMSRHASEIVAITRERVLRNANQPSMK